ncbi:unnamed protein product [Caenorhabditis angaria]|uniref:non-specific serine/threonine protein kinase n=1 Tax=Caenorhabditis angaria TaxID=860376 RepID=A0A9P1I4S7_9PELO|nr:unnamed protein product [Caenorhabditis angaria]
MCSENVKIVEVLTRNFKNYETLREKIGDVNTILYDFGEYQKVVDGQKTLDEAIKHNGRKLVLRLMIQKVDEVEMDENVAVKTRKVIKVHDEMDTNSLLIGLTKIDLVSNDGTICGKSYRVPSNTSRYSEKLMSAPKKYKIGKKLGEGTLGKVYIAEGNKGGTYAAKIIQKNGRKLPQEADVQYLKLLHHKRIVEYMYIIEPVNSNEIHILMEYMYSGSLKDYIEKNAPLHNELVKCYIKQIAEGLDFLHNKNIIHQDLKPANLLLKNTHEERLIKIADFGSSKFDTLRTKSGQQGRTPKYTAPEVTNGKELAGRRSDIWSFGVIVIEMFSGIYPWNIDGEHPFIVAKILEEQEPRIIRSERTDEDLINLSKRMISSMHSRPYASTILELPLLQDSAESKTNSDDSDSDYF